jgi:hypothetical protein
MIETNHITKYYCVVFNNNGLKEIINLQLFETEDEAMELFSYLMQNKNNIPSKFEITSLRLY